MYKPELRRKPTLLLSVVALVLAMVAPAARADIVVYDVTFSSLGSLQGSTDYKMDFYLQPQSEGNNSTWMSFDNFNYGSGGSGPSSLSGLTDTPGQENEIAAPFVAGDSLSFRITTSYTPTVVSPDQFSFGFYRGSFDFTQTSLTPTSGVSPGDGFSYFTISFDGSNPSVNTYAGTDPAFAAPTVTLVSAVATPEPQTWAMMFLGLGIVIFAIKRKKTAEDESSAVPVPIEPVQMR